MSELTDYDITDAMITMGGGFAEGLGRLWRQADDQNRLRLQLAFPDMWLAYRELAQMKRDQRARA